MFVNERQGNKPGLGEPDAVDEIHVCNPSYSGVGLFIEGFLRKTDGKPFISCSPNQKFTVVALFIFQSMISWYILQFVVAVESYGIQPVVFCRQFQF